MPFSRDVDSNTGKDANGSREGNGERAPGGMVSARGAFPVSLFCQVHADP